MAEPIGLSLAVAGLVIAFKGVVDGYKLLQDILGDGEDTAWLTALYNNEIQVIEAWGRIYMTTDANGVTCLQFTPVLQPVVLTILESMQTMQTEIEVYLQKYGKEKPKAVGIDRIQWRARRFKWVFKDKEKAEEYVNRVKYLTTRLMEVTNLPYGFILHQAARYEAARPVQALPAIDDIGQGMYQKVREVKERLKHGGDAVEDFKVVANYEIVERRTMDRSGYQRRIMENCMHAEVDEAAIVAIGNWWNEPQSSILWLQCPVAADDDDASMIYAGASYIAEDPKAVYCCDWTLNEAPERVLKDLLRSLTNQLIKAIQSVDSTSQKLRSISFVTFDTDNINWDQAFDTLDSLLHALRSQSRLFLAIDGMEDSCAGRDSDRALWGKLTSTLSKSCSEPLDDSVVKIIFTTKGYSQCLEAIVPYEGRINIMGEPAIRSPLLSELAHIFYPQ